MDCIQGSWSAFQKLAALTHAELILSYPTSNYLNYLPLFGFNSGLSNLLGG